MTILTGTRNSTLKLEVDSKASIQRDAFLGKILGLPAYKINEFIEPLDLKFLKDKNYGKKGSFFYTKLDYSNLTSLGFLKNSGFKIIEENITLERSGGGANINEPFRHCQQYEIRLAQDGDKTFVEEIAETSFSHDRFHQDPKIDNSLADEIKRQWAGNFFLGQRGNTMIVATANNQPVAFLLLLLTKKHSVIDLIAVSEDHRQKGLGLQMINYALQNFSGNNRWIVGTQSTNIASIRLYESLGFQTMGSHYVLHRHSF